MGRNMGAPIFANRGTLPKIGEKELEEAGKFLDSDVQVLVYRDKTIEYEDKNEVAVHIKGILEDNEPSLVITHYPDYAVHPDHDALGAAVIEAVRLMEADQRPTVWAQAITNNYTDDLGEPDIVHDIRDHFDEKMNAIAVHKSQADGIVESMKDRKSVV